MIYKYGLGKVSDADAAFGTLIQLHPGNVLALMAEAELSPESSYSGGALTSGQVIHEPKLPPSPRSYPNPFSSEVAIAYELPWTTRVTVTIYDASGRLVRSLVDGVKHAGYYTISWRGDDVQGRRLPTGVYFVSIVSEKSKSTSKLVLVR